MCPTDSSRSSTLDCFNALAACVDRRGARHRLREALIADHAIFAGHDLVADEASPLARARPEFRKLWPIFKVEELRRLRFDYRSGCDLARTSGVRVSGHRRGVRAALLGRARRLGRLRARCRRRARARARAGPAAPRRRAVAGRASSQAGARARTRTGRLDSSGAAPYLGGSIPQRRSWAVRRMVQPTREYQPVPRIARQADRRR